MRTTLLALLVSAPLLLAAQETVTKEFYPDGSIQKIQCISGDLAWFTSYYENGRVSERGSFKSGKPHGRWTRFDAEGHRTCKAKFDLGVRTGTWVLVSIDGLSTHRLHYRDNTLRHAEQYAVDGSLIATRDSR